MAKGYDIRKTKSEIKEIKQNIEQKKNEVGRLEQQKQALLDSMTQVEGSSIEEEAKQVVHEAINHAIEANREKGEQLSSEMGRDAQTLENNRQETTESISDATAQKTKLEQNQKLLERFGLGHTLDSGLSKLESNITELEDTNDEIIQTMQELSQITQKASNI